MQAVLLEVVHREHQDAQLRSLARELARRVQARPSRHGDVEDRQLHVLPEAELDGLDAVARLGDDLQVGCGVKDHSQPASDDRVVIGEQDPGA